MPIEQSIKADLIAVRTQIRGLKRRLTMQGANEGAKNGFSLEGFLEALNDLHSILRLLDGRTVIPHSDEIRKTVQASLKDLCTGIFALL